MVNSIALASVSSVEHYARLHMFVAFFMYLYTLLAGVEFNATYIALTFATSFVLMDVTRAKFMFELIEPVPGTKLLRVTQLKTLFKVFYNEESTVMALKDVVLKVKADRGVLSVIISDNNQSVLLAKAGKKRLMNVQENVKSIARSIGLNK